MNSRIPRWLLSAVALCLAAASYADIPPPDRGSRPAHPTPRPAPEVKVEIVPLEDGRPARIEIPARALARLGEGAAAPGSAGGTTGDGGFTGFRTVIAGLALSVAIALGGVWAFRRKRPVPRAGVAAVLALVGGLGFAASRAWGNAAPIFPNREPLPKEVRAGLVRGGGETVKIYLTGAQLEALLRDLRGPGAAPGAAPSSSAPGQPAGARPSSAPPASAPPPPDTPPTRK